MYTFRLWHNHDNNNIFIVDGSLSIEKFSAFRNILMKPGLTGVGSSTTIYYTI